MSLKDGIYVSVSNRVYEYSYSMFVSNICHIGLKQMHEQGKLKFLGFLTFASSRSCCDLSLRCQTTFINRNQLWQIGDLISGVQLHQSAGEISHSVDFSPDHCSNYVNTKLLFNPSFANEDYSMSSVKSHLHKLLQQFEYLAAW